MGGLAKGAKKMVGKVGKMAGGLMGANGGGGKGGSKTGVKSLTSYHGTIMSEGMTALEGKKLRRDRNNEDLDQLLGGR
jgi:hypothetical protein